MTDFFVEFFGVLMYGFYLLFIVLMMIFPVLWIAGLCQKDKLKKHQFLVLSGKLFLVSLLFFVVGFGSCVMVWELDPPSFH